MKIVVLGLILASTSLVPLAAHAQAGTANSCIVASRNDDLGEVSYLNNCKYVVNLDLECDHADHSRSKTLRPGESTDVDTRGHLTSNQGEIYEWRFFACQSPQWAADYVTGSDPTYGTVRWACQNSK